MKKFLSISLLLSMLFLYGCSTSNKLSADQLFEKKQECFSYKDNIEKRIKAFPNNNYMNHTLSEIFYSPKLNSCVYVDFEYFPDGQYNIFIVDVFSDNTLYSCSFSSNKDDCFNEISSLKGE